MTARSILGLVVATALISACAPTDARRPNVLILSLDSVRFDEVAPGGRRNPFAPGVTVSPLFERMTAEGTFFESAVSTTSWTLPAHMALLTGLSDDLHGVTDNGRRLHPDVPTMASWLGANGYASGGFFSGPNLHPVFGFGRGFDVYRNCGVVTPIERFEEERVGAFADIHEASHASVTSPRLLEESRTWIRRTLEEGDRPFFAFVHWWDPHYDYRPPAEYRERFDPDYAGTLTGTHRTESKMAWNARDLEHLRALYDAEVRYTDDVVTRLVDDLAELGVLDDTIVVVLADHGEEFYEHGRWGHQRTLFDEVVRIPLAIRWPAGVPAGVRPKGQARIQDVLPTIAELLDLAPPDTLEGRSVARLWREPDVPGTTQPLRLSVPYREIDQVGVRTETQKLLWDQLAQSGVAFDLEADVHEQNPRPFDSLDDPLAAPLKESLAREDRIRPQLPGAVLGTELEDALRKELQALGYLDDGE